MKQSLKYVGLVFFLVLCVIGYLQNNVLTAAISGIFFGYLAGTLNFKLRKPHYKASRYR